MPQKFDKKFSPNAQRPARRPGSARPEGERRAARGPETEEPSSSLVYGKNPVTELLKSGAGVDTVLLADTLPEAVAAYYTALAKEAGAVAKRVHANKLRLTCGTDSHQGVAAFASAVEYASLEQLLELAKEKNEPPFLVLCDGVEDPHNLGAIIRSALLCGAHGVVIPKRGGAAITPTVLKSSAGAAARLPVARVANIGESIRRLKEQGVFVYCADMDGAPLHKNDLSGPVALVMGSEGRGVSPLVKKLCDGVVSLSMAARGTGVDSFNVSVAAGIILYEIARQRGQG
ncbi:23S rRNA (guanosine(2251)-2'-O)-methyltransferase RlmB [Allofournierella massiliensis]|uniref:23S rRNA (Guanosine2251-2'-O)-methyltransferase n=1 Tax=Allofournierella massiliensis TaxID=1650663 RepID=A0A4R1QNM3_9FIRM|nr:23S rRNA (guanosine(2251)-2'-O)-methyltransferase RlmB [Fournierella massiliensis]TCL55346.1 23S rRNA (guanosine2251-2'-O)-methyltransferase [Fournierella massiliensis]